MNQTSEYIIQEIEKHKTLGHRKSKPMFHVTWGEPKAELPTHVDAAITICSDHEKGYTVLKKQFVGLEINTLVYTYDNIETGLNTLREVLEHFGEDLNIQGQSHQLPKSLPVYIFVYLYAT